MKDWINKKFFHPYDNRSFVKRILGYCNCPWHKRKWFIYPSVIHTNTRYSDEAKNYIVCCEDFYESEVAPQIEELWDWYYSTRL